MAKKLYEEADIQAIASAIRGKNGLTDTYKTSEMAAAITNLPASGGSEPVIRPLNVTENGEYTVPEGVDGYNPITVNVPTNVMAKEITANGVYNPVDDGVDGYSPITVNVPTSGGSSGGVIVNRANSLPVSYAYRVGGSAIQTLLVPFIWPAGAKQIYIKSELRTEIQEKYRLQYRYAYLDFNAVVVGSLGSPWLIVRNNGESDFTTSSEIDASGGTVLSTTQFYHERGSFLITTGAIKLSALGMSVPKNDTPCVLRILVKGYASGTQVGEIITLQKEAFN